MHISIAAMPKSSIEQAARDLPNLIAPKATSLIVTVFGDSLAPHGGHVWLGSLIELMAPLGLSERLVRTATNRLTNSGWLERLTKGRRSYFGLSETGRMRFEQATRRIYAETLPEWDGIWHLVVVAGTGMAPSQRESLRRELSWQGFGTIAPGVYAHPAPDHAALIQALAAVGIAEDALILESRTAGLIGEDQPLQALVARGWDLDRLAMAYNQFVDRFRTVRGLLGARPRTRPEVAFVIRSTLIHDYRRVMLHDPMLPEALLPKAWPGSEARELCGDIYRCIWFPVEEHVTQRLETFEGRLLSPTLRGRFGGLPDTELDGDAA